MRVHLARLNDERLDPSVDGMRAVAELDRHGVHSLTEDPDEADVVLFTQCHLLGRDWRLATIRRSDTFTKYRDKAVVYDERDNPWCAAPGVYVSMPSRWNQPDLQRAWGYYRIEFDAHDQEPDLLFSFAGSRTHPCREPLFALDDPRGIVDQVMGFTFYDPGSQDFDYRKQRFRELIARSRFVLCPRGAGTSSIRMYEVMASGRVPVVIADDWVAPAGPDWDSFTVRWPENRVEGLVDHLAGLEEEWDRMARAARSAFDEYFAPDTSFHHIIEQCAALLAERPGRRGPDRLRVGGAISAGARVWGARGRTVTSRAVRAVRGSGRRA